MYKFKASFWGRKSETELAPALGDSTLSEVNAVTKIKAIFDAYAWPGTSQAEQQSIIARVIQNFLAQTNNALSAEDKILLASRTELDPDDHLIKKDMSEWTDKTHCMAYIQSLYSQDNKFAHLPISAASRLTP